MALISCPKCNKEVSLEKGKCPLCNQDIIDCPKCKTQIAFMVNACPNCGHRRFTDDDKHITLNNGVKIKETATWSDGGKPYFFHKNKNDTTYNLYVLETVPLLTNIPIMSDETIPLDYYESVVLPILNKLAKGE